MLRQMVSAPVRSPSALVATFCVAAFAAGPPPAAAQQCTGGPFVFQCPSAGDPHFPTGPGCYCAGLVVQWPPGLCECTASFFTPTCWEPGQGSCGHNYHCQVGPCPVTFDHEQYCAAQEHVEPPDAPCQDDGPSGGSPPAGPSAPPAPASAGHPVSLTLGHTFFTHVDATVGDLVFSRSYHSGRAAGPAVFSGSFGLGWNHSWEVRLRRFVQHNRAIEVRQANGRAQYYFSEDPATSLFDGIMPYTRESRIVILPDGRYQRTFRAGGYEIFDQAGQLESVTDRAGVVTTLARDAAGRLMSISRLGRSIVIEYTGSNTRPTRLRAASAAGPVLADYTYHTYGSGFWQVETATYPDGSGYLYAYNGAARVTSVHDLEGKMVEEHTYISGGANHGKTLTSAIGNSVEKLTFTYHPDRTEVVDALGNLTTYWFTNVRGTRRVTEVLGPCQSCGGSGGERQRWTYDDYGRITTYSKRLVGAPPEDAWRYEYDAETGDLLKERDPLNQETLYTYDAAGRVLTVSRPDGGWREHVYEPASSPGPTLIREKVTATLQRETEMSYTSHGRIQTITDPRDKVTTLTYDPVTADLLTVTAPPVPGSPGPLTTTYTYYADTGRLWTVKDGVNNVTTYGYDGHGRVNLITDPDNRSTSLLYDKGGRRLSVTDARGRTTAYGYDSYGRLETVTDARLGLTRYGYNDMSNLTSITDARNKITTFEYDGHQRVKTVTYPGTPAPVERFTYYHWGGLETRTDREGVVTTHFYDRLERLLSKTYSDGAPAVSYTYDALGRILTASNAADSLTWTYDLAGQLVSEASSRTSSLIEYGHDLAGNRTSLKRNGQLVLVYDYDDASRLQYIRRGTSAFEFRYDKASRRTDLIGPRFASTSYGYDSVSRLLSQVTTVQVPGNPPVTAAASTYTYDAAGTRQTKGGDVAETYVHDELYRLTDVTRTAPTEHYGYDEVGNRKQTILPGTDWTYNDRNELLSNGSGGATFTYDLNGNLASKTEAGATWLYEWDAENRMTRVTRNAAEIARYAYDPLGRRVEKILPGPEIHTFVYDGEDILWQNFTSAIEEEGMPDPAPHLYIHGPGIDEPLAVEHGNGATWYYHADGLGSIVRASDFDGDLVHTRRYDAFGQPQDGAEVAGYAFTGREWDPETGFYYYRARYYDPRIGRFLSEDPLGFVGSVESSWNRYVYVDNNSVNITDPMGLIGVPAGQFEATCAWAIYQTNKRGAHGERRHGRFNHCVTACEIATLCGPNGRLTAVVAGGLKELSDTTGCFLAGNDCGGAAQGEDFSDNSYGASCPADKSCDEWCSGPQFQQGGEPGPFWWIGAVWR